ncbi:MAG: hypothetical protein WC712_03785 [Candidatus Brocadiia bacterium]
MPDSSLRTRDCAKCGNTESIENGRFCSDCAQFYCFSCMPDYYICPDCSKRRRARELSLEFRGESARPSEQSTVDKVGVTVVGIGIVLFHIALWLFGIAMFLVFLQACGCKKFWF